MSIAQAASFFLELDRLKSVVRKTRTVGGGHYENSAEHSWQVALMALALEPYAAEPVWIDRVVRMLLVHDVGEIDAGDVIVYAKIDPVERSAAELAGIERVFSLLPEAQAAPLIELWKEFEAAQTPEARFAHALDRAMPVFLNLSNEGQSWRENRVPYEQVVARIRPEVVAGCPALWDHMEGLLEEAHAKGWFGTGAMPQPKVNEKASTPVSRN
jgi:putative hydrolases of HD superfamily